MRYPEFLKEHGTIGFVAPSFGANAEPYRTAFSHALEKFRDAGYQIDLGPNCFEDLGVGISNTPRLCGKELNDYYCSKSNDVLISCGGGELMCEDLDYVDFERITRADPKWFMGYSDNTNMTFLLPTICGVAAVYGPCAPAFGMEPWHPAIGDAFHLLCGQKLTMTGYDRWEKESLKNLQNPLAPYAAKEPQKLRRFPESDAIHMEGRLLGGCMDCLVNLLGTKYDYVEAFNLRHKEEGILWFLESCDLNVMAIRRAVWQMIHAGWFRHARGFLIGRPYCFGQELMGLDQYHAVWDLLASFGVPVVMDVDLGHLPPMMPLVSGAFGVVDVKGNDIQIEMKMR